jgi:hypothetical protein
MHVALQLALAMQAELSGVFVEDADLLRVAALPFTREVGLVSGALRPLETADVESALRRQAEQVRRSLAELAQGAQVRWSFRVARGKLAGEVLAAAGRADVVVTGERQRVAGAGERLAIPPTTITAVVEPTEAGLRALSTALELAEGQAQRLSLLVPEAGRQALQVVREAAARIAQGAPEAARIEALPSRRPERIIQAARRHPSRALVLTIGSLSDRDTGLRLLMEESSCPLVLIL